MSLPEGALEQIPLGSSQEQVLIVLGTPSTVATVSGEAFYYISQRGQKAAAFLPQKVVDQRVIAVYFDKERRVDAARQLRHEGRQGLRLRQPHDADRRQELSYLTYIFKISARNRRGQVTAYSPNGSSKRKSPAEAGLFAFLRRINAQCARTASSSSATMLVILIIGFTAGPAVSL